ncbi:S-layer homology domain-containing protein [Paenibacillus sp. An7]|uniref:S-layer homology domain-containing protein n=1 Tax=Paenibacillus sp. An7 TaxID=2689577 RepID=UPI001359DA2B|nr:S-layer homology domain-containing protein [Paenibacillus sp. An7]
MKRLTVKTSVAALSLSLVFGGMSAYAFDDVTLDTQVQMLQSLRDQGIVKGVSSNKFNPAGTLSEAQGIQMIVNAFDLSAGNETTEPGNPKWYHAAYDAAMAEGLSIPEMRDAEEALTREVFANLLFEGINTTGEYPVILLYNHIEDEQEIKPEYLSSIQNLLNMKVISLGDKEQFRPRDTLTRMEAAEMVYEAREYIDRYGNGGSSDETPGTVPGSGQQAMIPEVSSQTIDEKTVKVKISLELPNPGYGLEIKDVELSKNGKAIIKYEIIQPDPNKMYPQVITERSAETNIPSGYTPEVAPFS